MDVTAFSNGVNSFFLTVFCPALSLRSLRVSNLFDKTSVFPLAVQL
jgi:hypothetical protein